MTRFTNTHGRNGVMQFRLKLPSATYLIFLMVLLVPTFSLDSSVASADESLFNGPTGIVACGSDVWVTNVTGDSLTELSGLNGTEVRLFTSSTDQFSEPISIASDGTDLWVANVSSNSIAEINCRTGSFVRNIDSGNINSPAAITVGDGRVWVASQAHQDNFQGNEIPNSSSVTVYRTNNGSLDESISGANANELDGSSGISYSDGSIWIANSNGNSVTELDARNGHTIRVINESNGHFKWPMGIAATGSEVWVANLNGNSLTQVNEKSGFVLREVTGHGLDGPSSVCVQGLDLWVTNLYGNSVTELNARTGSLIRTVNARFDGFSAPINIACGRKMIWITNQWSNSVTELDGSSGSLKRLIR